MKSILIFSTLFITAITTFAQESDNETKKRSRIMVAIGHMLVGQGVNIDGKRTWLTVPVWMVDYDYSISNKWTIGLHNDVITENFKVEGYFFKKEDTAIERETPIASIAAVAFKPGKHTVYSLGLGGEFSNSGNYFMSQLGFEYGFELPGDWELSPTLTYDIKWNAYDSFSISLGIGKKF